VLELNAGGTVNLTCERFNFTAKDSGEINTLSGALDLNMGGRKEAAEPEGQGVLESIHTEVESYFSEDDASSHVGIPEDTQTPLGRLASLDEGDHMAGLSSADPGDGGHTSAQASEDDPRETEKIAKRERWECRKGQIAESRQTLTTLPDGPEKDRLQAATDRFERNNQAVEHARLSQDVTNLNKDPDSPPDVPVGWKRVSDPETLEKYGLDPKDLHDPDSPSNFRAQLYEPDPEVFGDDMTPVIAFKGSEAKSEDWFGNNIPQAINRHSDYYENAVNIGKSIKQSGATIHFAGHSLGGGNASASSQASGMPATTFNAAGLNANTVERYGGQVHQTDIQAYRIKGEILTGIQEAGWGGTALAAGVGYAIGGAKGAAIGAVARLGLAALAPNAVGTPYELEGKGNPGKRHGIAQVIDSIEGQKSEDQQILESATGKKC